MVDWGSPARQSSLHCELETLYVRSTLSGLSSLSVSIDIFIHGYIAIGEVMLLRRSAREEGEGKKEEQK